MTEERDKIASHRALSVDGSCLILKKGILSIYAKNDNLTQCMLFPFKWKPITVMSVNVFEMFARVLHEASKLVGDIL